MYKIAYIVASEKMAAYAREILGEDAANGTVTPQTINLSHIMSEYRRLCAEGYEIILARGGTFQELLEVADSITVMEVRIQTSDILLTIKSAAKYNIDRIYAVLHRRIAADLEKTLSLLKIPVEVYRYETKSEMGVFLDHIPDQNAVVITSAIAEYQTSRTDLHIYPLLFRNATLTETVERAKNFLKQTRQEVQRINLMESILSNVKQGIIIFDSDNRICEVNGRAEQLLGLACDEMYRRLIEEVVPDMPRRRERKVCENHPVEMLCSFGGRTLNVIVSPFLYYRAEERYIVTLEDVTHIQDAERSVRRKLAKKGLTANYYFKDIITSDKNMKKLIARAKSIAGFEGSVLIHGENGTGKELFAQSIHNASSRRNGPFVAVNCAALTASLLESELFGYEGGAFTGARREGKAGLFELAHEGTIFLDEINSMPMELQGKILRVLEQKEVMRVGSDYMIPLDIRIIAASNQSLHKSIADGTFRKDLFYRLNTFEIHIPPLKERKGDVIRLFRRYLAEYEKKPEEELPQDPEFEELLKRHDWAGNVREVKNTALRYHAFHGDNSMGDILKNESSTGALVTDDLKIDMGALNHVVEELVLGSLMEKNFSKTEIARMLGISRQGLYKRLEKIKRDNHLSFD
ncbi:(S)-limonene 6-monooxygenase [uncultured Roseburia sp.]|uniref:Sigma 54-interacting transcriptional regulator n=1 Tax=Brotonthovivens ammoniilytica TaxID=2981725 RepID=A0ABT2TMH7_9FIRM|nr:sigma 54-interacting transcriptional regulator [Brotonthovivens ammoniilytica]MCU6762704.1 sigma 54-interacting transcriptional regulator [Brotonthovivens ammoniilytica]SCI85436.1 (S)-limonene 6-monooxygenase [uncultured Roseburia sp.]